MFKRYLLIIYIMGFSLTALSVTADPADIVAWGKGKIKSTGTSEVMFDRSGMPIDDDSGEAISINRGRLLAYTRAREKALQGIMNSLNNIQIDSDNRVADILHGNGDTQYKLLDLVRRQTRYREFPINAYTAGCRAELNIHSIISALPYITNSHEFPERMDNPVSTYYSSLIIDVRGLDVKPMVFPVIFNEDGLEIYSRDFININYASKYGMVRYVFSENEASASRFAGEHPFFTVALKSHRGSPVISETDALKIFSHKRTLQQLKKCRVIFIINRRTGNR